MILVSLTFDFSVRFSISDFSLDRCYRPPIPDLPVGIKENYFRTWHSIFPETQAIFEPTIEGAINIARQYGEPSGAQILITGSLYLVGGALRVLEPDV